MEFIKKSSKTDKQYTLKAQETENIIFCCTFGHLVWEQEKLQSL
jgi:hypothetical protein